MEKYVYDDEQIKLSIDCYEKSDVILSVFFAFIDLLSIVFFVLYMNSTDKKVINLKIKLLKLFSLDFIVRLFYTRKYYSWTFFKEFLLNFMNTIQFFLIVTFFLLAISKSTEESKKNLVYGFCIIFFFITFSYEYIHILSSTTIFIFLFKKLLLLIQNFYILYCISKLYEYSKKKIVVIVNNLKKKEKKDDKLNQFILGSPQSCFLLFSFYYLLKIVLIFIKNPIVLIYVNILINIVKEASKYFAFFICLIITYQFNKIKLEKEKKNNNTQSDEGIKLNKV